MNLNQHDTSFHYELKNIAYLRFYADAEYSGIISPYLRIYLITKGTGFVIIGNKKIILDKGFMYLIPGYTACSYFFQQDLEHIYIHFTASSRNGISVYNLVNCRKKIKATELNQLLFKRLLDLNPGLELPHHDPHVYQTKPWMDKKVSFSSAAHKLETDAIIQHLFSGFVTGDSGINISANLKYNIQDILAYIHQNLHDDIKMEQLARIACLSKDHFTRIFKSILGMPPSEYIIRKRIEKSQFLLLTTELSIQEIIEETNFKNVPYFTRMFKKYTTFTPARYRKNRFFSI